MSVKDCLKLAEAAKGNIIPISEIQWAFLVFHFNEKKLNKKMKELSGNEQQ